MLSPHSFRLTSSDLRPSKQVTSLLTCRNGVWGDKNALLDKCTHLSISMVEAEVTAIFKGLARTLSSIAIKDRYWLLILEKENWFLGKMQS